MKFVKTIIKKILRFLGWKLISLKIKKQSTFVNQKPELDEINCISESDGILHFGAHRGKEAAVYNWFNKKVLWIEANPLIFEDLNDNVKLYHEQNALNLLLGDINKKNVDFYLSNKDSSCSSIFDLSNEVKVGKLWKEHDVRMINKIKLDMIRFDDAVTEYNINLKDYNHWLVDLQGSEIQFLKGAVKSINYCRSIMIEISKKKFYTKDSTTWDELKKFLLEKGFSNTKEPTLEHCDILFKRNNK